MTIRKSMNRRNHFSELFFRVFLLIGSFLWGMHPAVCLAQQETPQVSDSLKVVFSHNGGFYSSSFNLQLDVPDQSYSILYTIDGSNPQTSKTAIKGGKSKSVVVNPSSTTGRAATPCFIVRASLTRTGYLPSLPVSQTYIFIDKVIAQKAPGGGWPTSQVNGQMIDLEMDPDVTKTGRFASQIDDALLDIPSISVVTDLPDMFDPEKGIYVNAMEDGEDWERFCSVELIDPTGKPGFNVNAGIRIRGGWSRHDDYPKHGFRLFFRKEYGVAKLKYPLFDDEGVSEFDKVDLRCEQNYAWSNGDRRNTCVREVFSRDTQRDMGQPYTRSRYYHLYLNGMYWGLYQTQERSEARYASDYFGGSKDDYDVVKVNANGYVVEATDGTLDSWKVLYDLCQKGFSKNEDYFALEGKDKNGYPVKGGEVMVDIDNLIDYMLTIFYAGNFDAPTSAFRGERECNNFYAIDRRDDKSSGFVFFNHDAEHSKMIDNASPGIGLEENRVEIPNMTVASFSVFHPQWLHHKLTANKEYRQRFADRVYKHFFNKGVFVPEIAQKRFEKRAEEIDMAIIAESARWGDARTWSPFTRDDWEAEIEDVYERFFPYRSDIVIDQLVQADLFTYLDAPLVKVDNQLAEEDVYSMDGSFSLSFETKTGLIFYTLDGSDPRMIGGAINPLAMRANSGDIINTEATGWLKARVKAGEYWSPLRDIKFLRTNEDYSALKVTEIHYHPTDSIVETDTVPGESFEFFELKNTGSRPVHLSGLKFSSAIGYDYKDATVLAPKQFHVIASKPKWFYEKHGMVPSGNFEGNFSNGGERVMIKSGNGYMVLNFEYFDTELWPWDADGGGYSLSAVERYPSGDPNRHNYWKSSAVLNGSPFSDDPGIVDESNVISLENNELKVFPNPVRNVANVLFPGDGESNHLEIFTLQGSKIFETTFGSYTTVDLSMLRTGKGMLIFKVKSGGTVSVSKVLFQP